LQRFLPIAVYRFNIIITLNKLAHSKKIIEILSKFPRSMLVRFKFSRLWFRLLISDSCGALARDLGLFAIVLSFEKKGL